MPRRKIYTQTFQEGLSTTGLEDGLRLPRWSVFQNIRLNEGPAKRRLGTQLIDSVASPHTALDMASGSSHHVVVPQYDTVMALKKRWTLGYLFNPDGVVGTQVIHGFAHAADFPIRTYLDGSTLTVDVVDSAGTTVTMTAAGMTAAKTVVDVIRSGTALSLWVNGALADFDMMADLDCKAPGGDMYFGRDNSGNYFDGLLDFARALSVTLSNQAESQMRLVDPRADVVLWDYPFEIAEATTKRVNDRSSHGNHGAFVGTPATGTAQTIQVTPVNLIHPYLDEKNRNRVGIIAGAETLLGEVNV